MKTEIKIMIAFILNLSFSVFELFGGLFTNSVAILSDALHDFGDAISIGLSYILEKKSHREADDTHTLGYRRYSVLGGLITTVILMLGSVVMIVEAVKRIITPVAINYQGMIWLGIIGVILNLTAAIVTHKGDSINQKSVNLHMLEDVLGWIVVLIGAVIMNVTEIVILDPIMSIGVAGFILFNATNNLSEITDLFLEKTPAEIDINELKKHISEIDGVEDISLLEVWSIDGYDHSAALCVITNASDLAGLKNNIRLKLLEHSIVRVIIETDSCSPTDQ